MSEAFRTTQSTAVPPADRTTTSTRPFPSNGQPVRNNDRSARAPSAGSGTHSLEGPVLERTKDDLLRRTHSVPVLLGGNCLLGFTVTEFVSPK